MALAAVALLDLVLTLVYCAQVYAYARAAYRPSTLTPDLDALMRHTLNTVAPRAGDKAMAAAARAVIRRQYWTLFLPRALWRVVLAACFLFFAGVVLPAYLLGELRQFNVYVTLGVALAVSYGYHINRLRNLLRQIGRTTPVPLDKS